jgi:hypothetical protein
MTRIRAATHTVGCIDAYCAHYRSVFHNVRHFEQFTQLILGMLARSSSDSQNACGAASAGTKRKPRVQLAAQKQELNTKRGMSMFG